MAGLSTERCIWGRCRGFKFTCRASARSFHDDVLPLSEFFQILIRLFSISASIMVTAKCHSWWQVNY